MLVNNRERRSLESLLGAGPVLAPNIFDCVSAKVMEQCGAQALYLPFANVAASLVGMPDLGLLDADELIGLVDRLYDMSPLPVIVDIGCGFGNEINVMRTCERAAKAGAAAVCLGDRPYQPAWGEGEPVVSRGDYLTKLRAAAHVLEGTGCLLIARTAALEPLGLQEAIDRCCMAAGAGVALTCVEGVGALEELEALSARVPGQKMFEMDAVKVADYDKLVELGFGLIAMEFAMSAANECMAAFAAKSKEDMSDIYAVEHSILPDGSKMTAFGNHEMFGANAWLSLGASFSDHSSLKAAGAFVPKD